MKELLEIITKYGEESPDVEVYDFTDPTPLSAETVAELQSLSPLSIDEVRGDLAEAMIGRTTKDLNEHIRQSCQTSRTCYLVLKREKGRDLNKRFYVAVKLANVGLDEVHATLDKARQELLQEENEWGKLILKYPFANPIA